MPVEDKNENDNKSRRKYKRNNAQRCDEFEKIRRILYLYTVL